VRWSSGIGRVLEVLDGVSVTDVAKHYGVSRQTGHDWLRR
jgi:transposase